MNATSRIIRAGKSATHDFAIHETKEFEHQALATYAITVTGNHGGYVVLEIPHLTDAERIAEALPAPSPVNSGARLLGATDTEFVGDTLQHMHYFLLENRDDTGSFEFDRLYDVAGLSSGTPVETDARRPDLAIIAIEETANWADNVIATCGRIKGVYGVNRNDKTYSQVWMEFLSNQFERPLVDLDESQSDEEFHKLGYDTLTDFERDNSGESGREIGRYEMSGLETLEVLSPPTQWIVEFMLETEEGRRLEMEREYYWEVQANGLPSVRFENPRSDAEIIEAGRLLLEQEPAPKP